MMDVRRDGCAATFGPSDEFVSHCKFTPLCLAKVAPRTMLHVDSRDIHAQVARHRALGNKVEAGGVETVEWWPVSHGATLGEI